MNFNANHASPNGRRRLPVTLIVGVVFIATCEVLLAMDVIGSGRSAMRSVDDYASLASPKGALGAVARWVAINLTALVWPGYLLVLDGLLQSSPGRSPLRRRPHHFATLCFASILIWCLFDWVNFYFMHAWTYLGVPHGFWNRAWGYFLAFACVVPGMLMTAALLLSRGWLDGVRGPRWTMPAWLPWVSLVAGVAMFALPLILRDPVANLTLWTSLVFLLDPINLWLGRPSFLRDWSEGWYGRTLALFAGGLVCGLLWEFWNFWALAKWIYHLPFLGQLEEVRYFEMPVLGLLGFIPFGLECWVMWQTLRIPLDGMIEPLPDERQVM